MHIKLILHVHFEKLINQLHGAQSILRS